MKREERNAEQTKIDHEWQRLLYKFKKNFHKKPDLQEMIFLIGVQEVGSIHQAFTKEEKEDLMHVGVCTLLSPLGYYSFRGRDEDGWPHFTQNEDIPPLKLDDQEYLLKQMILRYFDENLN